MPIVEMPWEDLLQYQGRTPRPSDHEAFWTAALDEMHSAGNTVELTESDFAAPFAACYHLWFRGVGGARIHAKYATPRGDHPPAPAVLLFHGYSGNSGDWFSLLPYVARGFSVASMDCRGQGGLSEDLGGHKGTTLRGHIVRGIEDGPKGLLFRQIFLDCAQLARVLMDLPPVDADRLGSTGWSQGGGLALACAALEPRIQRVAAVFPFLSDYRRVVEMDLAEQAYEELRTYFRVFDPRHEQEDEFFRKLGYIDIQHLAPRIKASVLLGLGLRDTVCPPSTQFASYNKISATKRTVVYPDYGHEPLPGMFDTIFEFLGEL
jgi:cephalosporin-C deacetylase